MRLLPCEFAAEHLLEERPASFFGLLNGVAVIIAYERVPTVYRQVRHVCDGHNGGGHDVAVGQHRHPEFIRVAEQTRHRPDHNQRPIIRAGRGASASWEFGALRGLGVLLLGWPAPRKAMLDLDQDAVNENYQPWE